MIYEIKSPCIELVSGGDEYTRTWGEWVGAAISEVKEHPVGAAFGVVGVVVAHHLSKH